MLRVAEVEGALDRALLNVGEADRRADLRQRARRRGEQLRGGLLTGASFYLLAGSLVNVPYQFVEVPAAIRLPRSRGGERQQAARAEHPVGLGNDLPGVRHDVERQTAGHGVEGGIGEGEVVCVHLLGLDLRHVTEV